MIAHLASVTPERKSIYIQTGQGLRDLMVKDTFSGRKIKELLDRGGLSPEFLPISIWGNTLINEYTGTEHFLFDGLPRRAEESVVLDHALAFYERGVTDVVVLNVSPEWAHQRLLERGRYDDTEAEIKTRFSWFERDVIPAITYFRGVPERFRVHDINGEQSIEDVQKEILAKAQL